jgi:lipoate-protein ligase A
LQFRAHFTIRHGEIQSAALAGFEYHDFVDEASQDEILSKALVGTRLHHISDWRRTLQQASPIPVDVDGVGDWLNHMFGIRPPDEKGGPVAQTVVETLSDTVVGEFLSGNIHL